MKPDLHSGFVLLDGGMGTVLQQKNVQTGRWPELLNLTAPQTVEDIHRSYAAAGSQILYTNTFGANGCKLRGSGHTVQEVVSAAVRIARRAADGHAFTALDIGPLGQLMEPLGTLTFGQAYDCFREVVLAGAEADLIVIETMADLSEARAALLAAKENSTLPVVVTMSFEANGRTYTGCTAESMARTLTALGADAVGVNCSLGPESLCETVAQIARATHLPVVAKPNAGLPDPVTGKYALTPEQFAAAMESCIRAGATVVGGCCGTDPRYLAALRETLKSAPLPVRTEEKCAFVCTPTRPVRVDGVRIIGERINPTGKKRFQQALLEDDLDYILQVGVQQMDAGADILDVNVGYPGVDEVSMLPRVVRKLQSAVDLPLQLDSSNPAALEAALRVCSGKAAVNSVNGDRKTQEAVLPLVKKYGASVIGLTLDENGIPETAVGRVAIARQILDAALCCGIPKEDVWIDCLTLTVSAQQDQAAQTLEAVRRVHTELGLKTVLGVSNISFGLPERPLVNRTFLSEALVCGLDLPILNPNLKEMTDAVAAHRVLSGEDRDCRDYVARYAGAVLPVSPSVETLTLEDAVARGFGTEAAKLAAALLETESELSLVENRLIPTLDRVGAAYEKGTFFLPQLLGAAQAAQAVFEVLRRSLLRRGGAPIQRGRLILATVQGDIHDIGKNIVKTVLENYGYAVLDLGRDVPPEEICRAAEKERIRLVGLSALMTTTLPAMERTVQMLSALPEPPAVMVGGAVVTPEYAQKIGADYYSKDAREAAETVKKVLGA